MLVEAAKTSRKALLSMKALVAAGSSRCVFSTERNTSRAHSPIFDASPVDQTAALIPFGRFHHGDVDGGRKNGEEEEEEMVRGGDEEVLVEE